MLGSDSKLRRPWRFTNHNIHIARNMPRILLVKTSSLGDVVHNLPVASDIAAAVPDAQIDWVVEQDFAAIPRLHGAVSNVIPLSLRQWRKQWSQSRTWRELGAFFRAL